MNIKITQKIINDLCGPVSFKRGNAFFRAQKVTIDEYDSFHCEATVAGAEEFHVIVESGTNGGFLTSCTCPKLTSFQKECQHIAAVLLAISERQRQEMAILVPPKHESLSENTMLAEGLLTLFNEKIAHSSAHQRHFEKRKILLTSFTCKPVTIGNGQDMFGIELTIESNKVKYLRRFLEHVKKGMPCKVTNSFTYDPEVHCFQQETDSVIQQLIVVAEDEKIIGEARDEDFTDDLLRIPPSSWERIVPLLENAPSVIMEIDEKLFEGLKQSEELLPLRFEFCESVNNGYKVNILRLNEINVMQAYRTVLFEGKLFRLQEEDCQRLSDLKQMTENSATKSISIPEQQVGFFLEKVVPGLKKIGQVHVSVEISKQLVKTPLIAKLYLDRVKNRLLAGLEFHYERNVINPLESRTGSMLLRDVEKENAILELMEEGSFAKTDGGYFLHHEELEYEFLHNIVPKLEKLVQIYATTAVRNRIFREHAKPQIRVRIKKERTNWLEFKFEMDGIPEKQIREILMALEEKRKFYRLRNGTLLSLETKEFEEIQRFLQAVPDQHEDLEEGLNVPIVRGLRLLDTGEDDSAFTFEESFRQFLDTMHNPGSLDFPLPESLKPILRDYQAQGFKWMKTLASYGFGGILADDMGLGKTLQSITFIESILHELHEGKQQVLIVCPSSVTYNWLGEFMKFSPDIQAVVVDGKQAERSQLLKEISSLDVLITSYPLLRKDIDWYAKQSFHTVFFDEAQNFKNPVTQTAKAVKKIQANHRFALTGTPIENSIEELWSIFHVVFPELFMGLKEFSNLTRGKIARRIGPFLLRRLKEDVLAELPEKIETLSSAELLPEQKKLYAAYLAKLRHDTWKHLDKDTFRKNRIKILAGLTRLRQICCHPALFVDGYKGSSAKFEQLKQLVEESRLSGRRVLIFSQFTKMLSIIGRELTEQGLPFFYLDGQTPSSERVETCQRFNEGERDFFLISLKAGGTGLNLTGADTVILYDLWWNPAVEEQAADRAHRMGQENIVEVIKLVARGTIEEKMNELQDKKRYLIEEIIDPHQKTSTSLTEEDIREILMF